MKLVISSGHGKLIRGASGYIDEVDEARRVVNRVASYLNNVNVGVEVFHDDVSTTQDENLKRIVDFHNSKERDLDVSVHFNAFEDTQEPMGAECLYVSQDALAKEVAAKISEAAGFKNRGAKKRTDLYFLNNTEADAILIETCFVDSRADAELYEEHFEAVCAAIAECVSGILQPPLEGTDPAWFTELITIEPVIIYRMGEHYCAFVSDLDICNDGSGDDHGDPHHITATAYYNDGKYLNADVDKYIVIPPQVREELGGKVMGCQARMTHLKTGAWHAGVTGEIGPDDKTGEAAYCLAKIVNPSISHNAGDKERIYLYELWPDIPAVVDGKQYELEG
jgi:hypothetical protein